MTAADTVDVARILGYDATKVLEVAYRPGTTDESVLRDVFSTNSYRLDTIAHDLDGGVVIDVGAHIGCVTLACLDRGARYVRAVEPQADNRALLDRNVAAYGEQYRGRPFWVSVLPVAVGDPARTPAVDMQGEAESAYAQPGTAIPVIDFRMLCSAIVRRVLRDDEQIALLKANAEASEYPLFATSTPELLARVNHIVIQWHPPHVGPDIGAGHDLDTLLDTLTCTHDCEVTGELGVGGMIYGRPR